MDSKTVQVYVKPNNSIYEELGHNNYTQVELLGELIDNSIGGMTKEQLQGNSQLEISIDIVLYDNKKPTFIIEDNGTGIKFSDFSKVIAPAGTSGGTSVNEHGFGMKQAVASLGELDYLKTKPQNDTYSYTINEFKFEEINVIKKPDEKKKHYTKLVIKDCNPILSKKSMAISENIIPWLGAKYRRYLIGKNKIKIILNLINGDLSNDSKNYTIKTWNVTEIHPNYFNLSNRTNKPEIEKKTFNGKGWEAKFTYGFAPTDEEYEELKISKPKRYEPYYKSMSKQGFDIIKDNRVITFSQLSEIHLVPKMHPQYNSIRGEIDLVAGFSTSTSKNQVTSDDHWNDLIIQIKDFLDEKDLLNKTKKDGEIPEKIYRNRLAKLLKESNLFTYKKIEMEKSVGELNGYIDILTDNTVWELKREAAKGLDVFQCFAYIKMGNYKDGKLIAPEFSTGVDDTIKFIKENFDCEITAIALKDFAITGPLTKEEFESL